MNHSTIGSLQTLFAQLWKEYALADSRYLSGDLLVLCAETITALVWGPLSYLTAIAVVASSPSRHVLQIFVSLGHFYGDLLYLSTSLVDLYVRNNLYSRPEPYYLWFYFVFLNGIWLVVPGSMWSPNSMHVWLTGTVLLYQSTTATTEAFAAQDEMGKVYGRNGRGIPAENRHFKSS